MKAPAPPAFFSALVPSPPGASHSHARGGKPERGKHAVRLAPLGDAPSPREAAREAGSMSPRAPRTRLQEAEGTALQELRRHRAKRISKSEDDDEQTKKSRSVKSIELNSDSSLDSRLVFVKKPSMEAEAQARKRASASSFFPKAPGKSRQERLMQGCDKVRKKTSRRRHSSSSTLRGSDLSPSSHFSDPDTELDVELPELPEPKLAPPAIASAPWQLQRRKLQAALEKVQCGVQPEAPSQELVEQAETLQKAVREKSLDGRAALAYCLVQKLGSLDNAFKYLDCSQTGRFPKVTWETALLILHLQVLQLTGATKHDIFKVMSGQSQEVSREGWDEYFAGLEDFASPTSRPKPAMCRADVLTSKGDTGSSQVASQLPPMDGSVSTSEPGAPSTPSAPSAPNAPRAPSAPSAPSAPREPVEPSDAHGKPPDPSGEPSAKPTESASPQKASRFKKAVRAVVAVERFAKKTEGRQTSEDSTPKTPKPKPTRRPSAARFATGPADVVPLEDDDTFLARIAESLEELPLDREVFVECSSRHQKSVLMEKAREKSYSASALQSGVLVVNEGGQARQLREKVSSSAVGFSQLLCPQTLQQFGMALVEEAGLTVLGSKHRAPDPGSHEGHEGGFLMDVLKDKGSPEEIQRAAEAFLDSLAEGEVTSYAFAATSLFRAALVRAAVAKGLETRNSSDGHLQLGRLHVFSESVQQIIDHLQDGEEHDFGSLLHDLQKQVVREKSSAADLVVTEDESMKIRRVTPSPVFEKTSALDELRRLTEAAFSQYATGRLGHQIFLRRIDLQRLACDTREGSEPDFLTKLDEVFDDTLELQLDIVGTKYGLSKEYFQALKEAYEADSDEERSTDES
ncbi:unnamed protein product [Effrenium voratum]|nr:unnamed protein product [Effrenium voratum]